MVKYSIIIPIYNSEKTLENTLKSILYNNYYDLEIIIVDDGSEDNSKNIYDYYSKKYKFIKTYYQKNSGVSKSRNVGLKHSNGKYVLFLDSDDTISKKTFYELDSIISEETDLILFGFKDSLKNLNWTYDYKLYSYKDFNTLFNKNKIFDNINPICGKVFRNYIIKNFELCFNESISYGEDTIFVYDYIKYCSNILSIPNTLYFIDSTNSFSLSRRPQENTSLSMINVIKSFSFISSDEEVLEKIIFRAISTIIINEILLGKSSFEINNILYLFKNEVLNFIQISNKYKKLNFKKLVLKLSYNFNSYIILIYMYKFNMLFRKLL